jgi:hypothetical protein
MTIIEFADEVIKKIKEKKEFFFEMIKNYFCTTLTKNK